MLRKLALVGLILLVGRGTIAQLVVANLLSFGFFALQVSALTHVNAITCAFMIRVVDVDLAIQDPRR